MVTPGLLPLHIAPPPFSTFNTTCCFSLQTRGFLHMETQVDLKSEFKPTPRSPSPPTSPVWRRERKKEKEIKGTNNISLHHSAVISSNCPAENTLFFYWLLQDICEKACSSIHPPAFAPDTLSKTAQMSFLISNCKVLCASVWITFLSCSIKSGENCTKCVFHF